MLKQLSIIIVAIAICTATDAQQYYTKNGRISFFSKALIENIKADNNQVISVLDIKTGNLQFSVLNNAFHFPKAKMEEHFNEDYMESPKYPRSTFKGTITDISKVNTSANGSYNIQVTGDLSIHGVIKKITAPGTIIIKQGVVSASSVFKIALSDYNISIPAVVKDNISNSIEITVSCNYEKK
jgi:polyisoprenoid-binding protein YceI